MSSRVVFNVLVGANEKAIPADVLVSKKIKSVKVDFDAGNVKITYEGEGEVSNDNQNDTGAGSDVGSEEVSESSEGESESPVALTGTVNPPVNETAETDGDSENIDAAEVLEEDDVLSTENATNEDEDKKAVHNADGDLDGDTSTTEGSPTGAKKVNSAAARTPRSGAKQT